MESFWQEVGFVSPDWPQVVRIAIRLGAAVLLASIVGYERERKQRPAGLRTHMLVALGAAIFTIVTVESGEDPQTLSRLVQGLAAGVGFLGAGAILKREQPSDVRGLTTAASIWLAAAIGFASGSGWILLALVATAMTYLILAVLQPVEDRVAPHDDGIEHENSKSSSPNRHGQ